MEHIFKTLAGVAFAGSIVFVWMKRRQVLDGQLDEQLFFGKEKILVWVACLLNPVWNGPLFYYGMRKKLPARARQANRISWIAFLIFLLLFGIIFAAVGGDIYAIV